MTKNEANDKWMEINRIILSMKRNVTCWEMGDSDTYDRLMVEKKELERMRDAGELE